MCRNESRVTELHRAPLRRSLIVGTLAVMGLLCVACQCEDCNGFYFEAWLRVEAATESGTPVAGVVIRVDAVRPVQTWTDTTDAGGEAVLILSGTSVPDSVTVSAAPPAEFAIPQSVEVAVIYGDTASVEFMLVPVSETLLRYPHGTGAR